MCALEGPGQAASMGPPKESWGLGLQHLPQLTGLWEQRQRLAETRDRGGRWKTGRRGDGAPRPARQACHRPERALAAQQAWIYYLLRSMFPPKHFFRLQGLGSAWQEDGSGDWHCTGYTVWAGTPHTTQTHHRDTYSTDTVTIHSTQHPHRHISETQTHKHRHTYHTDTQHSHTKYT